MRDGLLDTNVFIHAHSNDRHAEECRRFLSALEQGRLTARIEPLVLHEMSYALPHYVRQMTKEDVADYLLMVLSWDGVLGEKELLAEAVYRWRNTAGLSFADAFLAALGLHSNRCVYTKNVRHLAGQGVEVPDPLPS